MNEKEDGCSLIKLSSSLTSSFVETFVQVESIIGTGYNVKKKEWFVNNYETRQKELYPFFLEEAFPTLNQMISGRKDSESNLSIRHIDTV